MKYFVNEIYRTIQGEGFRYGIPHVFVRMAKCNLSCKFCDTEFESYREMTGEEIVAECEAEADRAVAMSTDAKVTGQIRGGSPLPQKKIRNVMFCGGEPLMQVNDELVDLFRGAGWFTVCETNGTYAAPKNMDWIACSPKVAEHAIKLKKCHELKYVRGFGQGIPHPKLEAEHYLLSPMFTGDRLEERVMNWCIELVQANPAWRLTIQHHKINFGGMR